MGTHQATHDDVCGALQKEADDWKAEALRALHATYNAHVNGIKDVPPQWKAAAAFSFCTGAVEKLFPASLGAALLARAAIPIWIYTEACKLYDQVYKNQARKANKLLEPIHSSFLDRFAEKIDEAETGLVASRYGRAIASQMQQAIVHRQFKDTIDAITHIRRAIDRSNILDDEYSTHRKRCEAGLGRTMDKVRRIYEGTVLAPGRNGLFLLRLEDAVCAPDRERWHRFQRTINVDDIDVETQKGKYRQELLRLKARFKGKVACVIPVETIAEGNIGRYTYEPEVAKILANIDKYEVVRDPADWRFGTDVTFAWQTEQPNFSIHTVAQTFNNKLPGEAMKAFTDAENQIWNNRRA